ncbi:restriction endonuclease subunit S [uncultured Fibrobacter sp.]|uniref:restriction endonuclease subunit S n=1 Tax=uncultured Fibrobacter sp. TaxID=261512 RepID=UPI002633D77B|nr:restriction endonuclease subunit S [uncultured Fibrobacter sp.]
MSEWKKVKIGEFLKQYRITIYVDDAQQYRQVTISSKDGVKYRCTKIGKEIGRKRQFLIDLKKYPNTVIFTRQGLHEGSIGLAPEEVDSCIATENMPMFSVDDTVIDTQYLKNLLRSPIFANLVSTLTPTGSAQKSIHERDLLPLEISIPNLETQKKIVKEISSQLEMTELLSSEIEKQKSYAKQLRQNILQEAIEGKLTADWRKQHPVQKGNPDYDAQALFDKIQSEKKLSKSNIRSSNNIQEKIDGDFVLDIPQSWLFVNLSELGDLERGKSKHRPRNDIRLFSNGKYPFVQTGDVSQSKYYGYEIQPASKFYNDFGLAQSKMWKAGTLCITIAANIAETGFLTYDACFPDSVVGFTPYIDGDFSNFVRYYIDSIKVILEKYAPATAQKNINLGILETLKIPLPPLAEQKEIVARVEQHIQTITQLETQIATRETTTKQLMQSILKDAFEED